MEAQNSICINIQVDSPYLPVEEFARRNGLEADAVRYLVRKGDLPIRKRKEPNEKIYINMIALAREAAMQK